MKPGSSTQIGADHESVSRQAAEKILAALHKKRDLLLCAAGGSTPSRTYELLVESYQQNPEAFQYLRIVKLDEWGGISMDDPGSCEVQLQRELLKPLGVGPERYFSLESNAASPELNCQKMRDCLAAIGPIDLCILGLGMNGHIGMNEPAAVLQPRTHVAQLTEVSLRHPMLGSSRAVPSYGLTLGMAEILASQEILLMVTGQKKREALRRLLQREIGTDFPASFLWLHSNCSLLCDREAAPEESLQS